jgi:MerR family transcriptional regulator, light-induced transcriptional regulator
VANELRIGELSRRVGLKPELLRAWETRYGLLRPARTAGGLRLYSPADERRVRRMQERLAAGLSAAEAARAVLADEAAPSADTKPLDRDAQRLREALDRFDAEEANAALDRLLASFLLDTVLTEVVLPYLRELGERWDEGSATVTQEHFASNLLRGRLLGLARGWGQGAGPRAVLACAPGELHDLPLIAFGLALAARGWSITYLGPDTPIATIQEALEGVEPRLVVVSSTSSRRLRAAQAQLAELARHVPTAIAGAGATHSLARATGVSLLQDDPVTAAERLADELG